MGRDPAVLFYTSDFLTGTILFSFEEKGKYIHLLCIQHQNYPDNIPEETMINICSSYDNKIFKKFKKDEHGNWYNERMNFEIKRRLSYCESRTKASHSRKFFNDHTIDHTIDRGENENENENKDENRTLKKNSYTPDFELFWKEYPKRKDKGHALKAWLQEIETTDPQIIIDGAKKYAEDCLKNKTEEKYIKMAQGWLSGQRWLDENNTIDTKSLSIRRNNPPPENR